MARIEISRTDLTATICLGIEVGAVFGRLTVNFVGKLKPRRFYAVCTCTCGTTEHIVRTDILKSGMSQSCGCLQLERATKHGQWRNPLYQVWVNMMKRCYDPKNKRWKYYGGRGITVCAEWHDIGNFIRDMQPTYQSGLEIDRKDFNGNYRPGNCRWVTHAEQARNKSNLVHLTLNGRTQLLCDWARELGMSEGTITTRIRSLGWSVEKALTTPRIKPTGRKWPPKHCR